MMRLGISVWFSCGAMKDMWEWEMFSPPRVGDYILHDGRWKVARVTWASPHIIGVELYPQEEKDKEKSEE